MQLLFQIVKNAVLISCVVGIVNGCQTRPLLMNDKGLYKFTDDSPKQYFLYLDKDGEWKKTNKKVLPSTRMIIFYEE